jgi:5-methylthioribose kinase
VKSERQAMINRNAHLRCTDKYLRISAESVTHPLRRNFIENAAVLSEEASLRHA